MSELNYKQWFWTECDELNKDTNFAYGLAERSWNYQQLKIDKAKVLVDKLWGTNSEDQADELILQLQELLK